MNVPGVCGVTRIRFETRNGPEPPIACIDNVWFCSTGRFGNSTVGVASPLASVAPRKPGMQNVSSENVPLMSSVMPSAGSVVCCSLKSTISAYGSFGTP